MALKSFYDIETKKFNAAISWLDYAKARLELAKLNDDVGAISHWYKDIDATRKIIDEYIERLR